VSGHTPGPWVVNDKVGLPDDYYHEHTIYDDAGRLVASALSDADTSRDLNRSFSNANLIAAAPDLLAALEMSRAILLGIGDVHKLKSIGVALSYIDPALAKATGAA
jgi:hypothetical protein